MLKRLRRGLYVVIDAAAALAAGCVFLIFVLMIVGVKMMTHGWLKQMLGQHLNLYLLAVVVGVLLAGILASLLISHKTETS